MSRPETTDRRGAGHWWWAAPDRDPPPRPDLPAARAYREVLLVFLAFFASGIYNAILLLAGYYPNVQKYGGWALYSDLSLNYVRDTALALAIVILLAGRRGISRTDLGLRFPRGDDGRPDPARSVRVAGWGLLGLVAGNQVNQMFQTGHLPRETPTAAELVYRCIDSLQAGVVEELVVLAFVVLTLRQARRPWWEVTAVALILRGSYHIYYGPGVFGILIWAAVYYWTFVRTGELLPLVVCHVLWDMTAFLSQRWIGVEYGAEVLTGLVWVIGLLSWLGGRRRRRPLAPLPAINPAPSM